MNRDRRTFLKHLTGASLLIASGGWSNELMARTGALKLVILHTNDVHSRIDPFPLNDPKFPGMGGFARRAELIRRIRTEEQLVLLLDAGDIFQGTPYFNLFNGEPEIRLMSQMGYDAATIGNHDFDGGMENLAQRIREAAFPFLNSNYGLKDTPLHSSTHPYRIFRKGPLKVGIFGLGIEPNGLIDSSVASGVVYSDPVSIAQQMSDLLRHDERCDLVICLSHLGYSYKEKKVSDERVAQETSGIDLIIGGHTHTFLDEPVRLKNKESKETLVAQAGWGGVRMGRIDFLFDATRRKSVAFTLQENISN